MFNSEMMPRFKKKQTRQETAFVERTFTYTDEKANLLLFHILAAKDWMMCLRCPHCSRFLTRRLFRLSQALHCPHLQSHFETMWIIPRL